ncbi:MAG: PEFG-CTERM sorting domain-containing protein [Candidatus Nitrosotenuis sp.]
MTIPIVSAYGHGLGIDTIKSINVNGKKIDLTTQISPSDVSDDSKKIINIIATDSTSGQNVMNSIIDLGLYHEGRLIFRENFFLDDGTATIEIENEQGKISGHFDEQINAWLDTETPIRIPSVSFQSGGLYHFEITFKTFEGQLVSSPMTYTTDVTIATNHTYIMKDKVGNDVPFGIKSYYDKITDFNYDPITNTITFEMPFDWSEKNISHPMVVHEEVHFPKEFIDLFVPSYTGKANGIDLFKSSVTIDDYSVEHERIVHFVLSQDNIRYLKQAQKAAGIESPENLVFTLEVSDKVVFPVIAMTKNEEVQVDLSWDPVTIEPGKNTKFIFTFRNAMTGEPIRNTSYDFILMQGGSEIYRKSGNAQIGGGFVDYTFSEGQTGQTSIRFERIGGTDTSTEFGVMVVPEFGSLAFIVLSLSLISALLIGKRFT